MAAPDISVVIPAFERVNALEGCLQALAAQTLPPSRYEVIVSDDGSRLPLREALSSALRALDERLTVRVIRQANGGPATARNRGASAATGRYLAFTDDDCRPARDWLERLLGHFAVHPEALVGGGLRISEGSDHYARATQAIMDFVYAEQQRREGLRVFSTSNLALSASGFRRLGGFSSTFRRAAGEDYDLCARWYKAGGKFAYAPDAIVSHEHELTLGSYWLQHFKYGRGLLQFRRRLRRTNISMRTGSLPGSFHLRLIASPVMRSGPRGTACALLVGLAQAATAAGVLAELAVPTSRPMARPSTESA